MPNVIDSLVVTLGLDPAKYKRGTKEAEKTQQEFSRKTQDETRKRERMEKRIHTEQKKNNREFVRQGKEAVQVYRKIRNEALGVLAVFGAGAGMVAFAKHTITAAANLHFAARDMGISVQKMAGYQELMKSVGGSSGDANSMLQTAASVGANLKLGTDPELLATLSQFGTFHYKRGDFDNTEKMVSDIANAVHGVTQKYGRQAGMKYASMLGFNEAQYDVLTRGANRVQGEASYFGKRSGMTASGAAAAQQTRLQFQKMAETFAGIMRNILLQMQPVFQMMLGYLQKFANWSRSHQSEINKFMQRLVRHIEKLGPVLKDVAKDVKIFADALAGLLKSLSKSGATTINKPKPIDKSKTPTFLQALKALIVGSPKHSDIGIGAALQNIQLINRLGAPPSVNNSNNTTTANAHIQNVHINTQATDGNGIMQDLLGGGGLFSFVPQSDGALQ